MQKLAQFVPLLAQLQSYSRLTLTHDLIAAFVVTVMLIPQSLAYALLAGLPPQYGLYASLLPLVVYALFGSSNTLAVGPVAIVSLMTATSLADVSQQGLIGYVEGAMLLAMMSGGFLLLLGVLRLGFLTHFLSHSVVAGFITASALVIALSQTKYLLGISGEGQNFFQLAHSLIESSPDTNRLTALVGAFGIVFLYLSRSYAAGVFQRLGASPGMANTLGKTAPLLGVVLSTLVVATFQLDASGVAIVGDIPNKLPVFELPPFPLEAIKALTLPAIYISIIGYVESVSVGKTLSAKRNEKIDGDQELIGLGAANFAAGISSGFPVTGGFARSVVNFDAGARTQMAGIYTAIGIALATLFLTPLLYFLPIAMLAATIIVAVLSLADFSVFKRAWMFSRSDFYAVSATVLVTLTVGIEAGVACGILTSILLHLHFTSKPHIAEIGLIPGTEHFRNLHYFQVETDPTVASVRIDESLMFSNAEYLEEKIEQVVEQREELRNIILHFGAVNSVDLTALEMLRALNEHLCERCINLHLSEVKIPIQQKLALSGFLEELSGQVYLSHFQAYSSLKIR